RLQLPPPAMRDRRADASLPNRSGDEHSCLRTLKRDMRVDDFVRCRCRCRCRGRGLRQRNPAPALADGEMLTVEIVGEFLGLDTDRGLHAHFGHLFPRLREVHRTTFLRQAANLWAVELALWRHLAAATRHDPALALIDSLP